MGGWASIRAWASIRDYTVFQFEHDIFCEVLIQTKPMCKKKSMN